MVEQSAVNREVVGSSPTLRANMWGYSSVWESTWLASMVSRVQIPLAPPKTTVCIFHTSYKTE